MTAEYNGKYAQADGWKEQAGTVNRGLMDFVDRRPCAFWAVANLKEVLLQRGFRELKETERWQLLPGGKYFVSRNGSSLISFVLPRGAVRSFHVMASHSDSPAFKIKPGPSLRSGSGLLRASVERYGGPIEATWFDRPLSVSGRVMLEDGGSLREELVCLEDLTLMIPSVAPHLLRSDQGKEMPASAERLFPVIGCSDNGDLLWERIAENLCVRPEEILGADLYLCNREKAVFWGASKEFIAAPRLDDLACCFGSFLGFLESASAENPQSAECGAVPVHCVFDNEEVGSRSLQGADSSFLRDTVERICLCTGLSREAYHQALAESFLVSADNAHAVHPKEEQLSDAVNRPCLNKGLVVKFQAAQRYATDGVSAAVFRRICGRHGIPVQTFTNRPGSSGGSTLGSLSASQIPLRTVDVGLPQLAMHSCYETIGAEDTAALAAFSAAFYREDLPEISGSGVNGNP